MSQLVVLCCVGLTAELIGKDTPHLQALANDGFMRPMQPVLPAVTTTAQSSMLTGCLPQEHGIVGNGWYFRELGEVWLWRQSQALIQKPSIWQNLRAEGQDLHVHKHFWCYAMNTDVDISVTPRPAYHADGAKSPDIYTWPAQIKQELINKHGEFPLFKFWGPLSNIVSTQWIADSFCSVWQQQQEQKNKLALCYLPHLDYDLQRYGEQGPHIAQNLQELDDCVGRIVSCVKNSGAKIMVVSEYGIEQCHSGIAINQQLRQDALLEVCTNATGELLDPGMSKAFAVCDHQLAHIYCKDADAVKLAQASLDKCVGIERYYTLDQRSEIGLDHDRSGEIVALAAPGYWFQYDYWLDHSMRPDFANSIEIHKKPGYDPRELFFDPRGGKARAAKAILKKKLGMRYVMNPVPIDASLVKGSHGRPPSTPEKGPVLIADKAFERDDWHQCEIAALIRSQLAV